jgi:hypothetical protein
MVAPLQKPQHRKPTAAMREAYRLVARTLLPQTPRQAESLPRVAAWKAWLFAGWAAAATAVYVCYLLSVLDW